VSSDPWTAFLDWLTTVVVPNWNELVSMLPLFVIVGVVGPILTLIALMWLWYAWHRRAGRVRVAEPDVVPAPVDAAGVARFPPNVPYCQTHALIHPPDRRTCEVDREDLLVRCPVDGTVRAASLETCTGCGTRYVLGAAKLPQLVRRSGRPPSGGAAVA
jgi:hypothetical protein